MGYTLAMPKTQSEHEALRSYMDSHLTSLDDVGWMMYGQVWVGLKRSQLQDDGAFRWIDDTPCHSRMWTGTNPSGDGDCGSIQPDGTPNWGLNDITCSWPMRSVCQLQCKSQT